MDEHDRMSADELHAEVRRRLAEGKPVGRLMNTLQSRGESTLAYQSGRTTADLAAHVRWKSVEGAAAPEETRELERRGRAKRWWKFW